MILMTVLLSRSVTIFSRALLTHETSLPWMPRSLPLWMRLPGAPRLFSWVIESIFTAEAFAIGTSFDELTSLAHLSSYLLIAYGAPIGVPVLSQKISLDTRNKKLICCLINGIEQANTSFLMATPLLSNRHIPALTTDVMML